MICHSGLDPESEFVITSPDLSGRGNLDFKN
jgi:hypothetical protein